MPPRRSPVAVGTLLLAGLIVTSSPPAPAAGWKVPNVVLGPDATGSSTRVEAPIAEVTVYSDRARVRRRAQVTLKAAGVVRLPDLPGAVFLDTVRVAATGGRIVRVEATPIERDRLEVEQARKLLDDLDAVYDKLVVINDRAGVDEWESSALGRLQPAPPVPEDKREGRKGLTVDVGSWWKALDFVAERVNAASARLVKIADERRQLEAEHARLVAQVAQLNRGGFSNRLVQVMVVLEPGAAAPVQLELEYFVPGARWKPAYNLHFSSGRGQLTMETIAVVEQTTGEDWPQAALYFSTATPGRGIDLPELLTWTVGERSEFVPHLRARTPPRVEPLLPMPAATSAASVAQTIDAELVRQRLARAATALPPDHGRVTVASPRDGVGASRLARDKREIRELVADALSDRAPPAPASAPSPPPRPMRAPVYANSEEDENPLEDSGEMVAKSRPVARRSRDYDGAPEAMAMAPPAAPAEVLQTIGSRSEKKSMSSAARTRPVSLSLVDGTSARRPPTFSDPFLPAVSGGGLDYVYRGAASTPIDSSGREVRVPLATQTFQTSAFYEATPALAATAFLRARVRNDGKRPLLRGPATIFGDGEFVGVGEIQTTGPSGDIEFPLGADQDIRLVRQLVPSSKTTGLIIKSEETVYDVQIQVGNYKKQAVTVEVVDQLPKTRNNDIEIKTLAIDPAPVGAPDIDGVVRWRVPVPAGETRTLKLRFQITRPKDWKLYQR
jgi:hypothetical protein